MHTRTGYRPGQPRSGVSFLCLSQYIAYIQVGSKAIDGTLFLFNAAFKLHLKLAKFTVKQLS